MFKALKMKIAARRIERKSASRKPAKRTNRASQSKNTSVWACVWNAICIPFRAIGRGCARAWAWIRSLDLIGLVNSTLLCAIIVLFSMLIIDIVRCNRTPMVIVARNDLAPEINVTQNVAQKNIQNINTSTVLPIKRDIKTRQMVGEPVRVARIRPDKTAIKQTARQGNTMYGDVIIDSRGAATMLQNGTVIKGNLYLQHMRKYVLPRGVRVEGNMFLRDMGMLQFAGEFTVTGNIYVTPTSSFGPIPRTARIGGQVIL